MQEQRTLGWEDVKPVADEAFSIFVGRPELVWARQAWDHVTAAGLAGYSTELQRCRACFRFLALATVYYDWCATAWQENRDDDEICMAAEGFEMDPLHIGQLLGSDAETDSLYQALTTLMYDAREEVLGLVIKGFGGPRAFARALWRSNREPAEISEDEDAGLFREDDDPFCDPWGFPGWLWVEQGCPPCR
jgi:hypothetical protein